MTNRWDLLIRNVHVATFDPAVNAYCGTLEQGAVAIRDGRIAWTGRESQLPIATAGMEFDGAGGWLLPGFIDCHTHLVYAGNRAREFEQRLSGVDYQRIAAEGGGIMSTVRATRQASLADLLRASRPRLEALLAEGVTAIEIKSGYGLDLASERTLLQAATMLGEHYAIEVQRTFLGAHALPPEFAGDADGYIDFLCDVVLPQLHSEGLVDAVDGFCENIAFSAAQLGRLLARAQELGLPVKLHAEQLSNQGGAALVSEFGGLSADHLEYLDDRGIAAMASSGTVAVLLPGAFYVLREERVPPIDALRTAGVPIALATDGNPGTSPLFSIQLILHLACTLWRLTPEEALRGVTRNAAAALGWAERRGSIATNKVADLVLWPIDTPAELACQVAGIKPAAIWINGRMKESR